MIPTSVEMLNRVHAQCQSYVMRKAAATAMKGGILSPQVVIEVVGEMNRRFGLTVERVVTFHPEFCVPRSFSIPLIGRDLTYIEAVAVMAEAQTTTARTMQFVTGLIPKIGRVTNAGFDYALVKKIGTIHLLDCYSLCRQLITQRT